MIYPDYESLKLDRPADRVLRITMSRGDMNAMDYAMHHDLSSVWPLLDADPDISAVVLAGEGRAFSAGGDFAMIERVLADYDFRMMMWKGTRQLVENIISCGKPIVSAISGAAAGGALAAALLADISIAGRTAKIVDGHTTFGIAPDDHAVILWPLLCGMAKAKFYLLTNEPLDGEEAERIGLVSMVVDDDRVDATAVDVAARLAQGPPAALRFTKHSLNLWLRTAWPAFEASLAYGILGLCGPEPHEGIAALRQKRRPSFEQRSMV